jgi:uncharacterized protein
MLLSFVEGGGLADVMFELLTSNPLRLTTLVDIYTNSCIWTPVFFEDTQMLQEIKNSNALWIVHMYVMLSVFATIHAFAPTVPIGVAMVDTRNAHVKQFHLENFRMSSNRRDSESDDDEDDDASAVAMGPAASNVLGTTLCPCCTNVGNSGIGTGYYRNGYCATGEQDFGRHTVCVQVTEDFLKFSTAVGNNLSTPVPQYLFPGLKHGDIWCLCAERWVQAYEAGMAPKIFLKSTHEKTLDFVSFDVLREYAIDQSEADSTLSALNEQRDRLNKLL